MDAFDLYLNGLNNKNKLDFAEFKEINWLNYYRDSALIDERNSFVLESNNSSLFKNTKPYYRAISPGCKLCGEGKWSCLFITNKCNASCFYCPASQEQDAIPTTQGLDFPSADEYAEYVKAFGFKGVAFSGGEPLLYFDKTLEYLKAVRKICPDVYIWIYTNGLLADREKMTKLADAGLNEIRFDIGATNYNTDKIKLASGLIPNITVEIPAVPKKTHLLQKLLKTLEVLGVSNLNLHQLRLTNYNAPHLFKHNYTFINAERPIVLESEISALEILKYAKENSMEIGVNYCSFYYKYRFQKAGFRKILANGAGVAPNNITENGFVRKIENNKLEYNTFSISLFPSENSKKIIIGNINYFLKTENAGFKIDFNNEVRDFLSEIQSGKLLIIPTDFDKFEIYRKECIETGLRMI